MSEQDCTCAQTHHDPEFIVVTGGPGAGKTATLEMIRRNFCSHVGVLPEAASIVFGGGFPRTRSIAGRAAAQRAIFRVQRELEELFREERAHGLLLCDRGTIDGLAYWPKDEPSFWDEQHAELTSELLRYAMVIHLRVPERADAYNNDNPIRLETNAEARAIDERILAVWARHPRRLVIEETTHFLDKVTKVVDAIRATVPRCCAT